MLVIRYVGIILVLIFFLVSPAYAQDDTKTDLERIQGSWKGTKLEVEGKSAPEEFVEKGKYVFKGDQLTMFEGDKKVGEATFTLDPDKKPKAIDFKMGEGAGQCELFGIYRIEKDTLTLCIGKERPMKFSGKGKAGLLEFNRAKPE